MTPIPPYQARKDQHGWFFLTATRVRQGPFPDRIKTLQAASKMETADKQEAETGTGAVSIALRDHFCPKAKTSIRP